MRTPGSIWLVALMLAAYGGFALWAAIAMRHAAPGIMGALTLAAVAGLVLRRPWSRLPVYAATAAAIASWGYSIWIVGRAGGLLREPASAALALAPGALVGLVFVSASVLVRRYFRRPPDRGGRPARRRRRICSDTRRSS
jgi:hypothetical protein